MEFPRHDACVAKANRADVCILAKKLSRLLPETMRKYRIRLPIYALKLKSHMLTVSIMMDASLYETLYYGC